MIPQTENTKAVPWNSSNELEVLAFELQGEMFALEAVLVQEILDQLPETIVPGAPAFVGSVINFRGKVIPLADLRVVFDMESAVATIDSRIVVIEMHHAGETMLVGLRTDKVHEVTALARSASEPPPPVGMRWRPEFIRCLVKRGEEFIVLPDLAAIFLSQHEAGAPVATGSTRH
jgi:purine-binding chemotaxis protein CheW